MFDLTILQIFLISFLYVHITMTVYEIYFHRGIIHNSVSFSKGSAFIFQFWIWLSFHLPKKLYLVGHIIHHKSADTVNDPHGVKSLGLREQFFIKPIKKIYFHIQKTFLCEGVVSEYPATPLQKKYLKSLASSEENIFYKVSRYGNLTFLILNLILFNVSGIIIYFLYLVLVNVAQHIIIDGAGHYIGYRTFQTKDNSRNIIPFGIWLGGSELHHNHHKTPRSAKNSVLWYEIDIGWGYIKILEFFNLCRIQKAKP